MAQKGEKYVPPAERKLAAQRAGYYDGEGHEGDYVAPALAGESSASGATAGGTAALDEDSLGREETDFHTVRLSSAGCGDPGKAEPERDYRTYLMSVTVIDTARQNKDREAGFYEIRVRQRPKERIRTWLCGL